MKEKKCVDNIKSLGILNSDGKYLEDNYQFYFHFYDFGCKCIYTPFPFLNIHISLKKPEINETVLLIFRREIYKNK